MPLNFAAAAEWPVVLKIAHLVHQHGGQALVVGGGVRDALTGVPVKDFDLEIHGLSVEQLQSTLEKEFLLDRVGMSFGILKIKHHDIDVALPRTENKQGVGHRGFVITPDPNLDLKQASARRDFTINAIMYDPLTEELLDPQHGVEDLRRGVLRHVSAHFSEDPLRVLRGMQFAARFNYQVAPDTLELCRQLNMENLPVERVGGEWEKLLLQAPTPSRGLEFLKACTWLRYFPELVNLSPAQFKELKNILDRAALRRMKERHTALIFMTSALVCQLPTLEVHSLIGRLFRSRDLAERCAQLVAYKAIPRQYEKCPTPDGDLRRLALKLSGGGLLADLSEIIYDCSLPRFRQRLIELDLLDHAPTPLLTGRHLMPLGIAPGRELGSWLQLAFEAQLDGRFTTTADGIEYVKNLLSQQ